MLPTTPPVTDLPTHDVLLNASSLKLTHCQTRYHNTVVTGLQNTEQREVLIFGKAVHKYAEMRANGADIPAALIAANAMYQGPNGGLLSNACAMMPATGLTPYVEPGGRKYVELKFKVYWQTITHAGHQFNIFVCGTFDLVTMFSDGAVQIVDFKTSRKYKMADVFADYMVDVQMAFYPWVAARFGAEIFDITVANQTHQGNVFLRICAVMLAHNPVVWKMGPPIMMGPDKLDEFERLLQWHIRDFILPSWLDPQPTGKLNNTCTRGERAGACCDYVPICFAENSLAAEQARAGFAVVKYDPAAF